MRRAAVAATLLVTTAPGVAEQPVPTVRTVPVRLLVTREVTTKTARAGDRFPMQVIANVVADGRTVVPAGAKAWGEVVSASESGAFGKSGKLATRLVAVDSASGPLALHGETSGAGTHGAATTTAATIGFALLGSPLGLLTRGTNAKLKAGDVLTADVELP